jgi:PilZ domain
MMKERRSAGRIDYTAEVVWSQDPEMSADTHGAALVNYSETGLFLLSNRPILPGSPLYLAVVNFENASDLRLKFKNDIGLAGAILGEVVWCQKRDDNIRFEYEVGIEIKSGE